MIPGRSLYTPISSTRQIRRIVQMCFDAAIGQMVARKACQNRRKVYAKQRCIGYGILEYRRMLNIDPREHVRDDAGHSSSLITDKYIDITRAERHQTARKKMLKI